MVINKSAPLFSCSKAIKEGPNLHAYLMEHKETSDLLVTGGDPMVMKSSTLSRYLLPLMSPTFDHIQTIRIGTKALTYWPQRFVSDPDADELLFTFPSTTPIF